jgi:exonuclease VII small subunit
VKNEIQPYIERQEGVASVSPLGLVEQSVHIELDKKKIDDLNAKLLETVDEALSEAAEELEKAEKEVQNGKWQLQNAQSTFGETFAGAIFEPMGEGIGELTDSLSEGVEEMLDEIYDLRYEITDGETGEALDEIVEELEYVQDRLNDGNLEWEDLIEITGHLQNAIRELENLMEIIEEEMDFGVDMEDVQDNFFGGVGDGLDDLRDAIDRYSSRLRQSWLSDGGLLSRRDHRCVVRHLYVWRYGIPKVRSRPALRGDLPLCAFHSAFHQRKTWRTL